MDATSDWTDEEFLRYFDAHCCTERALFSYKQARRLLTLAGAPVPGFLQGDGWISCKHYNVHKTLGLAWERVRRRARIAASKTSLRLVGAQEKP